MPVAAAKLTVEEYAKLPPPADGKWELRHGELHKVTFPKKTHNRTRRNVFVVLRDRLSAEWEVDVEVPFRPAVEFELWSADVALVSKARYRVEEDWLTGAPEIVIEILSPSNSASEMLDREQMCFAGGCMEFWVVDPGLQCVRISRRDGSTNTYTRGQRITLSIDDGAWVFVDEIFG